MNEHAPAGTPVQPVAGSTAPVADTKDPWQRPLLRYRWAAATPTTVARLFSLDAVTGAVTVSALAGDLKFVERAEYALTVEVVDALGKLDAASVTVRVNDVNDAPQFAGVANAAHVLLGAGERLV
ncbi:MAG: cadherin repeat domain-containing protein, partial [Cytophagaceae bacterium]